MQRINEDLEPVPLIAVVLDNISFVFRHIILTTNVSIGSVAAGADLQMIPHPWFIHYEKDVVLGPTILVKETISHIRWALGYHHDSSNMSKTFRYLQ